MLEFPIIYLGCLGMSNNADYDTHTPVDQGLHCLLFTHKLNALCSGVGGKGERQR